MYKIKVLLVIMLISGTTVFCINHMDLIQTMTGEFNGSEFGFNMASIDFNVDGYDDLVVSSSCWNPNGVYSEQQMYGKLYFYWGGPIFDNASDLVIPGTHPFHYCGQSLFNAGDINGDGHDDLVIANKDSTNTCTVEIFYSRNSPQTAPDVILTYPTPQNVYAFPLGDINNDNHADLGFLFSNDSQREQRRLKILTDITAQPIPFRETNNTSGFPLISGVGDVNQDEIDDFYMYYPINGINSNANNRLVLYYGSTSFPVIDSLVISEDTQAVIFKWGNPVGDVNGDGIDDFVGYHRYLWLGNVNLTASWDMLITSQYGSSENYYQYTFQHGDFNNDGYDDIVSGDIYEGYYTGVINIWLGRQQMNGTVDLNLWNPIWNEWCNFSWAKAVGDFNADGCDDLAVSAPWWMNHDGYLLPGKVFIFAGNTQLEDTTVANDDNTIPVHETTIWDIIIYPNPVHNSIAKLKVQFIGSGYKTTNSIKLEIYNIRGQKLLTRSISNKELLEGTAELTLKDYHQGCYVAVVKANKQVLATKKIYIITN